MEVDNFEEIYIHIHQLDQGTTLSSSSRVNNLEISFHFTYKKVIVERYQDKDLHDFVREHEAEPLTKIVRVNTLQGFDAAETTSERELSGWDLSNYSRELLIKQVLSTTQNMLQYFPSELNSLSLSVEVTIVQNRTTSSSTCDAINNLTIH